MSKHLLRTAMAVGIAALALSVAAPVRAQGTSTSTNAPAATPRPKRQQYTGMVESIDTKAGTAIVKKNTDSKTFKIGDKTKYSTVDKKDATVADIKVGDKVTVWYTDEGGVLTAAKIGVPASVAKKEKESEEKK